jgi:O-antigen ligase
MVHLSYAERRLLSKVIIGFGLVSVFLGLMQLAQGPNSTLRFFEFTNPTEAVGFFANRNHFSALLYVVTLFASCWVIDALASIQGLGRETLLRSRAIVVVAAVVLIFIALVIGQTMARSRAGLMLSIIALFAVLALAMTDRHGREMGSRTAKLMFGAAAFAIVFSLQFALLRILERFEQDPLEDARVLYARKTFELVKAYLPLGTGMGTFVPVYAMHEKPADLIPSYANRAHNDVLEVSLESGILGMVLMGVFALWLLRQTIRVWGKSNKIEAQGFDLALMKASTVGLWLLAAHSFVDYPLRTGAIMTLAAFACGLLIPSPSGSSDHQTHKHHDGVAPVPKQRTDNPALQLPKDGAPDTAGVPREPGTQGVRPRQLWQTDKEWPESWRTKDSSAQPIPSSKSGAKEQDPGPEGKT